MDQSGINTLTGNVLGTVENVLARFSQIYETSNVNRMFVQTYFSLKTLPQKHFLYIAHRIFFWNIRCSSNLLTLL